MTRIRVLMISHTCQSPAEGQPKVRALLQDSRIELKVIVPDRWMHYGKPRTAEIDSDLRQAIDVVPVRFPWAGPAQFYLHYYPSLGTMLRTFKPDVIDLWEEPWGLVSHHTIRVAARVVPSAKIVSETEQNIDKQLPPPFEWFRKKMLARADHLVGRSHEAIEVARRKGFSGQSTYVPNGVDTDRFAPGDRAAARATLGISGFVAGYVGRLVPEKGLMDFLHAIARTPEATGLFIGDGPMREALLAESCRLGIGQRVRFEPARPSAELPMWMNAMDVLVLPSRTTPRWKEQFGRVLVEAGACGTPVIGSNSGAIPDVVGQGGLIFPEGDVAALAGRIRELAADPARRTLLGHGGLAFARGFCDWRCVARQMADIYGSLAGR